MSDTKWTAGPWQILDEYATMLTVGNAGRSSVCEVESGSDDEGRVMPTKEEQANALLIAAAPELYEALDTIVANFGSLQGRENSALEKARAALAKARGQS